MRSQVTFVVLAILTLLPLALSPAHATDLSDDRIVQIVDDAWSHHDFMVVPSGPFVVYRDGFADTQLSEHRITTSYLNGYVTTLASAGLLTATEDQDSARFNNGESFSWDQFFGATTDGIVAKFWLTPSDAVLAAAVPPRMDDQAFIEVPSGSYHVTKVLKNLPRIDGADEFRVVSILYDAQLSALYQAYLIAGGHAGDVKRKARLLLKYDEFEDNWRIVALDVANVDEDFTTQYVK